MSHSPPPPSSLPLPMPPIARGSLARTLLVVFLPLVVGPLVTVAVLLYLQVQANITRQISAQLTSLADLKENQIDQWALARTADMNNLVRSPDIVQYGHDLVLEPKGSAQQTAAAAALSERLTNYMGSYGNIEYKGFMIVEADTGEVLLATSLYESLIGQRLFLEKQYFVTARQGALTVPPYYDPRIDPNNLFLAAAGPIVDPKEGTIAVLIGALIPSQLQLIVSPIPGLTSGRSYIVTHDGYEFGQPPSLAESKPSSAAIERAMTQHVSGDDHYTSAQGRSVFGAYRWMPRLEIALIVEEDAGEAFAPAQSLAITLAVIAALAVVIAAAGVILFTRSITLPIQHLTTSARQMAGGDLTVRTALNRSDEIGILSNAFDSMAAQLRDLLTSLEERVAERTRTVERRTAQITAGAEIAKVAGQELNPYALLHEAVNLIRDRFDLYYVGAFMLDDNRRYAVLRAGTGEAGQAMIARGHRLEVGGQSMIGQAISDGKARIALDVGQEAVRFNNPALPNTRSEMALPLAARERVIGALTIQSDQPSAFAPEDIVSLQGMADLIAVALDNARLFQEAQNALNEVTALHKSYISQAWATYAQKHGDGSGQAPTYSFANKTLARGKPVALPALEEAIARQKPVVTSTESESTVTVPIRLRDQIIGAVAIESETPDRVWDSNELAMIEAVIEQAALSLENARLIEEAEAALAETRRLAAREQTVNAISSKLRRMPSVEGILTTALVELGRSLGASKGQARLGARRRTAESRDE